MEFLIKKKQRKLNGIETHIKEYKDEIESFKDTAEFGKLTGDLNKNIQKKGSYTKITPLWTTISG